MKSSTSKPQLIVPNVQNPELRKAAVLKAFLETSEKIKSLQKEYDAFREEIISSIGTGKFGDYTCIIKEIKIAAYTRKVKAHTQTRVEVSR